VLARPGEALQRRRRCAARQWQAWRLTRALSSSNSVVAALGNVSATGSSSELTAMVPDDVMGMIDQGRNPDAHTRTFISRLVADNQHMASMTMALDVSGVAAALVLL